MPTYNIKRNGWKNLHKNTRSTGSCYERKAADYLKQQGLFILRYNYRCRFGEIDLIARDGEYLVFVEVKYRKDVAGIDGDEIHWVKNAFEYIAIL